MVNEKLQRWYVVYSLWMIALSIALIGAGELLLAGFALGHLAYALRYTPFTGLLDSTFSGRPAEGGYIQ